MAQTSAEGKIGTLAEVTDALEALGYEAETQGGSIFVKIGGSKNPFTAVVIINKKNELVITCQLATLGAFKDEAIPRVAMAALDANTRIRPYAYGIITDADTPELQNEEEWVLVLTDSIPLGDLSTGELAAAMNSLLEALISSRDVLEVGLAG